MEGCGLRTHRNRQVDGVATVVQDDVSCSPRLKNADTLEKSPILGKVADVDRIAVNALQDDLCIVFTGIAYLLAAVVLNPLKPPFEQNASIDISPGRREKASSSCSDAGVVQAPFYTSSPQDTLSPSTRQQFAGATVKRNGPFPSSDTANTQQASFASRSGGRLMPGE